MPVQVTVRLYATLRKYQPPTREGEFALELAEGARVSHCAQRLGVPDGERYLAVVNGSQVPLDHPLQEGDRVALFPPIAGGYRPG